MTAKTILAAVLGFSVLAGCDAPDADAVGPRGGVVMSDDGRLTLDIPAGALTESIDVRIEVVDDAPQGSVGTVYTIEPAGVQLLRPATLTYDLAADDADDRSLDLTGVQMDDLVLITEKGNGWQPMADRELDVDAETLSASVLFLSSYAIASR